jgi:hypothetical protein
VKQLTHRVKDVEKERKKRDGGKEKVVLNFTFISHSCLHHASGDDGVGRH